MAFVVCGFVSLAGAQVVVDWPTKTLVSYPAAQSRTMNVTVTVNNVNNLLYSYSVRITQAANSPAVDDAAKLAQTAANAKAGEGFGDCTGNATQLNANVSKIARALVTVFDPGQKKDSTGKLLSISLAETEASWISQVKNPWNQDVLGPVSISGTIAAVQANCTGAATSVGDPAIAKARQLGVLITDAQAKVDGPHQIVQTFELSPDNKDTVTVVEWGNDAQTATFTADFTPQSNVLTLSLGTLLSDIQQRSYSNAKDPSNVQQNLLSVDGAGRFSTLGTALLNYQLPWGWADGKNAGLAISSGLVLKFGDTAVKASSLGWFGGGSVHLFHRLFISGGLHVGQFSDYPVGLHTGSVVPSNYGDLTGVTRTTARFAFGITYQTKQFSTGSTTPSTTSTGGKN